MADQLCTPADLASWLQRDIDAYLATLAIETATGLVQAACGQRLVQVVDDPHEMMGTASRWLELPQRPVTAVSNVQIDGQAVTDWKRFGAKLFRVCGWGGTSWSPAIVTLTYTHGWVVTPTPAQELQPARSAVLSLARGPFVNASGATSEAIDDYRITWEAALAEMTVGPTLEAALRRRYGLPAGLVAIGG